MEPTIETLTFCTGSSQAGKRVEIDTLLWEINAP